MMNGLYLLCFAIATLVFRSDAPPLVGEDGNRDISTSVANDVALGWGRKKKNKKAPPTARPTIRRVTRTMAPTTRSPTANPTLLRTMAPTTRSPTAVLHDDDDDDDDDHDSVWRPQPDSVDSQVQHTTVVGAGISCLRSDLTCPNSADPRCSRCDKDLTCVVRAANHTLGTCMLVTSTPPALPDTCAKDQACFDAVYTCATCCTSGTTPSCKPSLLPRACVCASLRRYVCVYDWL